MNSLININQVPPAGYGFIYLLCCGDAFKIGVTTQTIRKRIQDLQTGNSNEIWCRDYVSIPRKYLYDIEKMIHLRHHMTKIKNEWYELESNDLNKFRQNVLECLNIINQINETEI